MSLQIDFQRGAKEVLDRVLQAYGFSTKLALAEHLGIASSSLANRYSRGFFPSDIVVRCMADTGVSLRWLAAGEGEAADDPGATSENSSPQVTLLPRQQLDAGKLVDLPGVLIDPQFFTFSAVLLQQPLMVVEGQRQVIAERQFAEVQDGEWLLSLEGQVSIRQLTRIPPGRVRVSSAQQQFECALADITPLARIVIDCQAR